MDQIDGGIGGGQVLRLAVSLAALGGTPITVENVRGGRDDPGLGAQHVAAIEAVAAIADADLEGVEVGSETVIFDPGSHIGGEASVDVGTAGSISLVFDAVLPLVMAADDPIVLYATGGTDVKWAPPIDYLREVKFPVLEQFGLDATIEAVSRGFYPRGGGSATLRLEPGSIDPIWCVDRGDLEAISIRSIATADLAEANVAARQIDGVTQTLEPDITVPIIEQTELVDAPSTGTSVLVVARYERSMAGFSALGEPGLPAEEVGKAAAESFFAFQNGAGGIDEHLADQLLPFLGVAGGTITTPKLTDHIRSAVSLLSEFGDAIDITEGSRPVRIASAQQS
ncbi:MAG: RNA 3'-terminal phosphate cyclase [Halodesulfurarchaeum sp.]|nr:RNA 3'-terminal phosphate cyclase [Halodesulfurarchaeum sp.]